MKTLADLLQDDGAVAGDVYEACGQEWRVSLGGFLYRNTEEVLNEYTLGLMPVAGWTRVRPKKPLVVEFTGNVRELGDWNSASITNPALLTVAGKRVKVTVEEIVE